MKTPTTDPIVNEVRSVREKHAAQFGYDIHAIFKDIQKQQAASGRKFVRYSSRPEDAPASNSGLTK